MADVISVSSGSDDDSDIVLIGSFKEAKEDAVPFIREEWLPVTPVSFCPRSITAFRSFTYVKQTICLGCLLTHIDAWIQ